MNIELYESLINNISKSIKLSLNEMARKIDHRTIDRKVWLSVASACSRNKDTEAEFIKPMKKLTLEDLINRYVAALIIMKKPCPTSEKDIDTLKTFKLLAKRALELGSTINDIKTAYNINAGIIKKTVEPVLKIQKTNKSNKTSELFNDDIIDDTNTVNDKIVDMMDDSMSKLLDSMLKELHDAIFGNDVNKYAETINKILDTYDQAKYNKTNRIWELYVGYEETYSPKVYRTQYELRLFYNQDGCYSYLNKEKVLQPGETMFNAMDRKKHWREGYGSGYWDKHDCDSEFKMSIYRITNDGDELNFKVSANTGPEARKLLYDKLAEGFKKAYLKLDEILEARNKFDGKKYGFDKKPSNYVDWVALYVPLILRNNGYTNNDHNWYTGISIRNANCSFWTGNLKTCTPDGIIFWVGGDSTDDEDKISYSEWKSRSKFSWYSDHAKVSANIDYGEKEEFSENIYNLMLQLMKDGKIK